jgi:hypothetical protein
MITVNRLDKAFGPVGTAAGISLFIAGLIISFFSFTGPILVLIGAFVGFTSTSTLIDHDSRSLKFSNNIFGIIKTGQWIKIEPDMKIGIKKSNKASRAYSRSNLPLDIVIKDFRLILYDSNNKQILTIQKTDSLDSAKVELEKLCNQLGLTMI